MDSLKGPAAILAAVISWSLIIGASPQRNVASPKEFAIRDGQFLMNGLPYQILSGEIHYFRVPEAYWKDRLLKARAMGLNTICTYVFWNTHEPEPGRFDFSGNRDVAKFVRLAGEAGLNVIVRPGPYACAEWDFGGFPAWLLRDPYLRVRCMDKEYLEAVERYALRIGQELAPLQCGRGGPIIMLQLENEYGSYGSDKAYLRALYDKWRKAGFTVPIYNADGPGRAYLENGTLDATTPVINFGSGAEKGFQALKEFRSGIPEMCGEYWVGWFTHWGSENWGDADERVQRKELEWMLSTGKSVNLYMFHGGTNWAFWAGANHDGRTYMSDITSYDYGAPLDEAGNPTAEYYWMRDILAKYQHSKKPLPPLPKPSIPFIDIPNIALTKAASVWINLPAAKTSAMPHPMEYYGQDLGYILYRTKMAGNRSGPLVVKEIKDYGRVYLDGKFLGKMDRRLSENSVTVPKAETPAPQLDIFVEALGRVNFGPELHDRKGITEYVSIYSAVLMGWEVFNLPMDDAYLAGLKFEDLKPTRSPTFFKGEFELKETGDTFLDLSRWKKGFVVVNGHTLGRFWEAGPQRDLYLPGCWLKKGKNEVIVFDLEKTTPASLFGTKERRK